MKAIVTGGAGFIGSHLVDKLIKQGHKVKIIDNLSTGRIENLSHLSDSSNLELLNMDINDLTVDHFKGINWVFHLAALADIVPSIQMPTKYYKVNVSGTLAVLEAARHAEVDKVLYAASSSCYGIPDVYPTNELAEIRPCYPYALTKNLGEQLMVHWGNVYKLPFVSLRLFNVYGTRSRTSGTYGAVFGVFLAQKLAGKPYTIVGDGQQTRDFTYVTDVVEAFYAAAKSDIQRQIFNVGSGHTYSVNRLVELLEGETVYIPKRPGEPDCTFADISKIKTMLGWQPQVSLENGVKEIIKNIDYWREAPVWDSNSIDKETADWFKYLS